MNDQRFRDLPMVIETPRPTDHADAHNLAILRALTGRRRVTATAKRLATHSRAT